MSDKVLQQLAGEIATLKREIAKLKLMEVPAVTVWTGWTPSVTQGVSVTATVVFARYAIIQDTVHLQVSLTITSGGTGGSTIGIGDLPADIANSDTFSAIGTAIVRDTGTATYPALVSGVSATVIRFISTSSTAGNYVGANPSFALANTDNIVFTATYEKD